ncbi:hypothetical protein HNR46_002103 [Haloferula luteola]|uniref:Lipoprotein n=1 Tax=Haloferula luteola TaxID=595692 RepID=A0A840V8E9_9BACT|nr:hypothetical protein [Haloferula luteola]MBB5351864.1 hypothetical protein [Haloferula luteola]
MRFLVLPALLLASLVGCKGKRADDPVLPPQGGDGVITESREKSPADESLPMDGEAASPKTKIRPPKSTGIPVAKPVEGAYGKVINPKTGNEVFAGGLPAGTILRDPEFPDDEGCYFTVPEMAEDEAGTPIALSVAGKDGFVFSPYNNKIVDVGSIPAGTLVMDPTFPAAEKKAFRVPVSAALVVEMPDLPEE